MQKFIIAQGVEETIEIGCWVAITGQDVRHIRRVLRLGIGDGLSMTDGNGHDYIGVIKAATSDRIDVRIDEKIDSNMESPLEFTLCTAMLKHKKMDGIIKQITQLGVTRWIPFFSERSVPQSNAKKAVRQLERWQTIANESLKQCRRSRRVQIIPPTDFTDMLNRVNNHCEKIVFWENGRMALCQKPDVRSVAVLIGPEGGFSEKEIEQARESGFVPYLLGPRILRAETASVCAAGLVQYIWGDMGAGASMTHRPK